MIRNPAVAGQFYYYDLEMLNSQITELVDLNADKREVLGLLSPHAGYMYSGGVAGAVLSRVKIPDTFVILGPNHTGLGAEFSIFNEGMWRMPFGDVIVDSGLAKEILLNSKFLNADPFAHQREHSIEVQIPFLQYFDKKFQIVPIAMSHYTPDENFLEICHDIGNAISTGIQKTKEKVVIIASSDLTHYEPKSAAEKKDGIALDAILELNPERLFKKIRELGISMCGFGPAASMLYACKNLGAKNSELVKYRTSGDVTKDYSAVVGYGGVLIW